MVTPIIFPEKLSGLSGVIGGSFPALDHAFMRTGFNINATPALILPFKLLFFHTVMYYRVSPNYGYEISKSPRFLYTKSCYIPLNHHFDQFFKFVVSS